MNANENPPAENSSVYDENDKLTSEHFATLDNKTLAYLLKMPMPRKLNFFTLVKYNGFGVAVLSYLGSSQHRKENALMKKLASKETVRRNL